MPPPLDASGVLTLGLLRFLAGLGTSAQKEQGDMQLDYARRLARENEEVINSHDLEVIGERILRATVIKMGLESEVGIYKYFQARRYRGVSRATLNFVMVATEPGLLMSRDYRPPPIASAILTWLSPLHSRDIWRSSVQGERGDRWLANARKILAKLGESIELSPPNDSEIGSLRKKIDLADGIKAELELAPKRDLRVPKYLRVLEYRKAAEEAFKFARVVMAKYRTPMSSWKFSAPWVRGDMGTMKSKFEILVENLYGFEAYPYQTQVSRNVSRAELLLKDMNFIYPDPQTRRNPYRHSIIQRAINTTWFRSKYDVGVLNHGHFFPIPISVIAVTLTMIECCINEWISGTRRDYKWDRHWDNAKFQTVCDSHISSLLDFQAQSPVGSRDVLYQLRYDLWLNAREHAGVPPDSPLT